MVQGKGINNMPYGWASENEENKRIYQTWVSMIQRCYSEKCHEKNPTYKDCTVCDKWLYLSNFVRDFKLIEGYDNTQFLNGELVLDKDIKSDGVNKEYSLENCMLVSKSENSKQANKTRDYKIGENNPMYGRTGENHPRSIKICQYDKKGNLIKIWNSGSREIERETGINHSSIIQCCKGKCKSTGGFVWKYYIEEDD